jgi:hypothetical protein
MLIHYFYNLDYLKEEGDTVAIREITWPASPPESPINGRRSASHFSLEPNEAPESVASPELPVEESFEDPQVLRYAPPEPTDDEAPGPNSLDQEESHFMKRLASYKDEKKCKKCTKKGRKCKHIIAAASKSSEEVEAGDPEPFSNVEPEPEPELETEPAPEPVAEPPESDTPEPASDYELVPTFSSASLNMHIKVYALAQRYWIPALENLALDRFKSSSEKNWDSREFLEAAAEVYTYAPLPDTEGENPLKDAVMLTVYNNPSILDKSELREVMNGPDLAFDMLRMIRDRNSQGDQPKQHGWTW